MNIRRNVAVGMLAVAVAGAAVQLILFRHHVVTTRQWTDGQAKNWTVFTENIDALILVSILGLTGAGTFVLSAKRALWVRILLAMVAILGCWLLFYIAQYQIQYDNSGFTGV